MPSIQKESLCLAINIGKNRTSDIESRPKRSWPKVKVNKKSVSIFKKDKAGVCFVGPHQSHLGFSSQQGETLRGKSKLKSFGSDKHKVRITNGNAKERELLKMTVSKCKKSTVTAPSLSIATIGRWCLRVEERAVNAKDNVNKEKDNVFCLKPNSIFV